MSYITELGERAKQASRQLAVMDTSEKNRILAAIADALETHVDAILVANAADVAKATDNGISDTMVDRLRLTGPRVTAIADAVRYVAGLNDPVGRVLGGGVRPNGMSISKITVPLGVVGIIFESRPNVTVDCAVLCLKSGNACILRGGKEAINSNTALAKIMRDAVAACGANPDIIQLVEDTARETAAEMMRLNRYIDVLIPRGGAGLISTVIENSTIPVIETGVGNCHAFVDASADLDMAAAIVDNGKTSRPSVCNALETLLVHQDCAGAFLPMLKPVLDRFNVELRGCGRTAEILGDVVKPATEEDWLAEFSDYILAVKVVSGLDEALDHISAYSTHHSEVIITKDYANSRRFTQEVDSAAVYVNVSTRFTDGGEFGLGAEIGISTQKLHARGPMGLDELVSYKYIIAGDGQTR